jgi:hypothetical protein
MSVPAGKAIMKKPILKGQRSLDSFLFKAPSRNGPSGKQGGERAERTAVALEPPSKKPRIDVPEKRSSFFQKSSNEAIQAEPSRCSALDVETPRDVSTNPAERSAEGPAKGAVGNVPKSSVLRHQRFQNKLVENPAFGQRKQVGSEDIVPQKHTPLELQVLALKKKHPECILIIEVSHAIECSCSQHCHCRSASLKRRLRKGGKRNKSWGLQGEGNERMETQGLVSCTEFASFLSAGGVQVPLLWRGCRDCSKVVQYYGFSRSQLPLGQLPGPQASSLCATLGGGWLQGV